MKMKLSKVAVANRRRPVDITILQALKTGHNVPGLVWLRPRLTGLDFPGFGAFFVGGEMKTPTINIEKKRHLKTDPKLRKRIEMPRGRPTLYKPEFVDMERAGRRRDCTIEELADSFGIKVKTLYDWKAKYPQFSQAIHESRVKADAEVECAAHELCVGHYYEEEVVTKNGPVTIKKYHPPSERMIIFWLMNRQPAWWRDTKRH